MFFLYAQYIKASSPNRLFLLFIIVPALFIALQGQAQMRPIHNDAFRYDISGHPIYSQGGGIFLFKDANTGKLRYYWYGVHYQEADNYLKDPSVTSPHSSFQSVTCYSSDNMVDWTFEADVLTKQELSKQRPTWVGRLGVAYIKEVNKYAMFVQHGRYVLVTVSDLPTGPFRWYRQINMEPMIGTSNTGDQTVFTDDKTGKSYLIYSYGKGRNKIYVSEIGVKDGQIGLLDCTEIYRGAGREGNCMFKYKGKYYMCASNLYGWDGSDAYYLVSDNIKGPYLPANNMKVMPGVEMDYAHVSQTGFFVTIKGREQETVVFCGDRWADFAGNGLGYNQWCPLSFNGSVPQFNSVSSWNLDAKTGLWQIGRDNNYIKNGSFEADRRHIPSPVKPVQEQLLGWTSDVIKGTVIKIGDSGSPQLNYFNTREDRQTVVGEKSLQISDHIPFERRVFQRVSSTPSLPLPAGSYDLTATIKTSAGFNQLYIYVKSGGKTTKLPISDSLDNWKTYTLKGINIRSSSAEVGFYANGTAGARCLVDDVTLIASNQ